MPRAHRCLFEPPKHFVLGHVSILGLLSALGSPHTVKRFIDYSLTHHRITHRNVSGPGHSFRRSGLAGRGFTAVAGAMVCGLRRRCPPSLIYIARCAVALPAARSRAAAFLSVSLCFYLFFSFFSPKSENWVR